MSLMDFTPAIRWWFDRRARRTDIWGSRSAEIQEKVLRDLLRRGHATLTGFSHDFSSIADASDIHAMYARDVESVEYEDIRPLVMRMVKGERNVLWPGVCVDFAQSSGTSGGKSKFIPITRDSLRRNHIPGAADSVALYLRDNPASRIFAGKGFILGGSFANELDLRKSPANVGDLSATLISRCPALANLVRIPDKKTALLADWSVKLPLLVKKAAYADVTNISGVPSWFLAVIKGILAERNASSLHEVWPNLEVFFHGGISFAPYRQIYSGITDPSRMHFRETYNASEGFFAAQDSPDSSAMLLLIDNDIYYEFIPLGGSADDAVDISGVVKGKIYELMITCSNGLWRYRLGDTVRIESIDPVRVTVAGRTRRFINAFGEELMEDNAERGLAEACRLNACAPANYTVAPVFAGASNSGRHQWLIEWQNPPADMNAFARDLDNELRKLNSDYDAKRSGGFFLDAPEIISLPTGTFDRWLAASGNHKLGGQRKVPRLSNDRSIADEILRNCLN